MRQVLCFSAAFVAIASASAQQPSRSTAPQVVTATDYARAERLLSWNVTPLVYNGAVRPTWLADERFWYRNAIPEGTEFIIVDAVRRTRARAFDHAKLASALSLQNDTAYGAFRLPFAEFDLAADGQSIVVDVKRRQWTCHLQRYTCTGAAIPDSAPRNSRLSPDGNLAAFIRDYNLWVKDLASGRETQLTTDGEKDFGYATDNAGWVKSDRPVLVWSPDSKKIATFQHDGRGVGEMYLVDTKVGHPNLQAWKYPLPGDSLIFRIHRVVIHLDGPRVVRFAMPADPHRSSLCDHILCGGEWADVKWSPDGAQVAFVSTSRDHKYEALRVGDAATGTVRTVLEETETTFFESGNGRVNWNVLFGSNEVLWYSQRDDWGHLYLYDLRTGQLKRQVTSGAWNVLQVLRIDEKARTLIALGSGRDAKDPYFRQLYSIRIDDGRVTLLTPEDATHDIALSLSGRYVVDAYSRPEVAPVSMLRDAAGKVVLELEKADIARLQASGWTPPIPFTVKARDGKTDLYGLLYRPTGFDSTKKYPIINNVYPGPQSGSVGGRSFNPARGDTRALSELGFVVVQLDAMGTPLRSKSFHEAYYGNMGDNGLPDQIAGMRQLAQRYPWIDLEKAGVYGHSGGGFASTDAILRYPDFFKVAVSQAGNHDNRNYEDDWGEKWQGLLERRPDGSTNYDDQANQNLAKNLKGKLLIAHGTMDANVPYYSTLLVVNELIRHNKDFELIMFPNRGHGFGNEPYMVRRRWDFFVKHLMGAEPPAGYEIKGPGAPPVIVP